MGCGGNTFHPTSRLEERQEGIGAPSLLKQKKEFSAGHPHFHPPLRRSPVFSFCTWFVTFRVWGSFVKSRKVGDWAVVLEWGDLRVF